MKECRCPGDCPVHGRLDRSERKKGRRVRVPYESKFEREAADALLAANQRCGGGRRVLRKGLPS